MGEIQSCSHKQECCPNSSYAKIRYIKEPDDIKLFGAVPYKSDKWKAIYKDRTSTERMNNRILNDYHLHSMKIRNRAKFMFFTIFAGINIHLDVQVKVFESALTFYNLVFSHTFFALFFPFPTSFLFLAYL